MFKFFFECVLMSLNLTPGFRIQLLHLKLRTSRINKILRFSRKTGKIQNIHKGQYNSKYVRKLKPINNNNSNIMPCYASAQDIPMVHFIRVKVLLSFYTGLWGPIWPPCFIALGISIVSLPSLLPLQPGGLFIVLLNKWATPAFRPLFLEFLLPRALP